MEKFRYSPFLLACFAIGFLVAGCGGSQSQKTPTLYRPAACSAILPNYCSDLTAMYYWSNPIVTYRIVSPGKATSIQPDVAGNLRSIPNVEFSPDQAKAIRDAFIEVSAALNDQEAIYNHTFIELQNSDLSQADIDLVLQTERGYAGPSNEQGFTDFFAPPVTVNKLARVVIRIKSGLSKDSFTWTARHEIECHAQGFQGHSTMPGTLGRGKEATIGSTSLTVWDINTLRANNTRN